MTNFNGRKPILFMGHLERYVFALQYVHRKKVLDLGSKDGYGSHLLSCFADHVTLVDRTLSYMESAKKAYTYLCPVEFQLLDLEDNFPIGVWDVIVAFEIIEHVANYEQLIFNIASHLNSGGLLVFSVPHMIPNDDHKVLFDEEKIKNLISKYLVIEEFYIQDKEGISGKPATSPPKSYVGIARKV